MEIKEILNSFSDPKEGLPSEAINAALNQQEAITPHLLSILEHTISSYESTDPSQMDYIFSLYLLSKFREKKAFPLILAMASLPGGWPENLVGDDITESLSRFIVSTFGHDLFPIKKVIEDPTLNGWSRNAALKSFLRLVATQRMKREELIEYLRSLFHSPLAEEDFFVTSLVNVACDLYPEELMEEINDAFKQDKVDTWCINEKWIKDILALGKESCLQQHVYDDCFHLPIDDVEKEMNWVNNLVKNESEEDEDSITKCDHHNCKHHHYYSESEPAETYIRSFPKIGRSDLCVCGSGKKYKKCCLTS